MLSISDGTSVTAREWSQVKLAEFGWVLLLEPITGKELGFFRFKTDSARFAGPFDRRIQKAKTPVCAVEGCACVADKPDAPHWSPGQAVAPPPWRTLLMNWCKPIWGVPAQGVPPVARGIARCYS